MNKENEMKKLIILITGSAIFFNADIAKAEEKYTHFPSLDAPTTSIALCNLVAFNEKLQVIAEKKELTPEDMVKVHEITYTLENAIIKLQKDLDTISVDLEKVHKASEQLDQATIKYSGDKYLGATGLFLAKNNCK